MEKLNHMNTLTPPDFACPNCSHLRRIEQHSLLLDDVLAIPSVLHSFPSSERRYRDRRYRVIGCPCIRPAFGPHPTEQAAREAIRDRLVVLRSRKERS